MEHPDFKILLDKYLEQRITSAEKERLFSLLNDADHIEALEKIMDEQLQQDAFAIGEDTELRDRLFEKIQRYKKTPVRLLVWKRVAVAAAIILVLGAGSFFFFYSPAKRADITKTVPVDISAPNTNRAMIQLADGRQLYLDSAGNGQLAEQNGVQLVKLADGRIAYAGMAEAVVYNTLVNPKGSKVVDMTLGDGTRVWLNAGSSVRYPVTFTGSERKVAITGEAYFEVAHNAAMPFKVTKGGVEVTVLGTHFNVNAYDDEPDIRVTLLEGSVQVQSAGSDQPPPVLKPGQQAQVAGHIRVVNDADIDQVMAWKNGLFEFKKSGLGTIMRQISNWYNVQIVYEEADLDETFTGSVPRIENVSQVLKMLEYTNTVHFKIERDKIIVTR